MTNPVLNSQIDLTYLKDMSDGDESFINMMLETFLTNVPEVLENIEAYHKEEKWVALAEELHKLKPTLKYLGVNSLNEIMPDTEANCKALQNFDQIGQGIAQITEVTKNVLDEARTLV